MMHSMNNITLVIELGAVVWTKTVWIMNYIGRKCQSQLKLSLF